MAAKWRDGYQGDLSPRWFWQLCFCSVWGRCPAESGEQTLTFAHIQRETVVLAPWCKSLYLIQVCSLIVVGKEAQNHSIISKFDNRSGAVRGQAVVCVERIEQGTQDIALWGSYVQGDRVWGELAYFHNLRSAGVCLMRLSEESRCRVCIQSGRRKSLTHRPAMDMLLPLRRSSVPAACAKSHWAENETLFSPWAWWLLLRVAEHSIMLCTRLCFLTKDRRCMQHCVG